jgi:hypothetical protein
MTTQSKNWYSPETSLYPKNKSQLLSLKLIKKKKKNQNLTLNKNSNFIKKARHQFKTKIYEICELLKYSDQTFYLSYQIFIKIANARNFPESEIEFWSYMCLMLSSKFNETPDKILKCMNIESMCPAVCLKKIINFEKQIFCFLDYNLVILSESSFLNTYLEFDETVTSQNHSDDINSIALNRKKFKIQSRYILNLYMFSRFYGDFDPEIVALSIITLLRIFNDYHDNVFANFTSITELKPDDLGICLQVMNHLFEEDSKQNENQLNSVEFDTEPSLNDFSS